MTELGLGQVAALITPVSGGFLHRMYKVETDVGVYAVKHLNPEIMKRPSVMENYSRAELLEKKIEAAGIPIVPSLERNGKKMQMCGDDFFYIFCWLDGRITDWDNITPEQCEEAGRIQGKIHAIEPKEIPHAEPSGSEIDWASYTKDAESKKSAIADILRENEDLLIYATESMNDARRALPDIECITDEDMDPKNVMWKDGNPYVIDLECLDYGNPANSALQLALQWAGVTTCSLDFRKMDAFFEGYREAWDGLPGNADGEEDTSGHSAFDAYEEIFGVAYTWVEWLEYNVIRALGQCQDDEDRKLGESEVRNTIERIRYIYEREDEIKAHLFKLCDVSKSTAYSRFDVDDS